MLLYIANVVMCECDSAITILAFSMLLVLQIIRVLSFFLSVTQSAVLPTVLLTSPFKRFIHVCMCVCVCARVCVRISLLASGLE